jgi:acyl-CoA ligase (AMP-forming) (exosortase A-associated)
MGEILSDLLKRSAGVRPDHSALLFRGITKSYADLANDVKIVARGFLDLGLGRHDRVAIYLDKQFETVVSILGAAAAGAVFVPINPALKALQVAYILNDCNVRVLVTTKTRLSSLDEILLSCPDLRWVFLIGDTPIERRLGAVAVDTWVNLFERGRTNSHLPHSVADTDMVGILYTSGSTGNPKGVVLSHCNLVLGAASVAQYLRYQPADRILNLPPYSFDFGLNQLFSSLHAGTTAVLHNFLTAQDLLKAICAEKVTGVSGVPTVMIQLAALEWPSETVDTIRYMSTTGGRMPEPALRALRKALPKTDIYLMYGLTESFRSTYLPPNEVDRRPNSIGKPIPNAEVLVVRPDGTICDPGEPGELVHKGPLVSQGYWNDPMRTAERFRPAPGQPPDHAHPELAVWSGDTVMRDEDGFIYFIGRKDEMIKTSGYRVSPTEIEEAVFASGCVGVAAAVGVDHPELGQAIIVFASPKDGGQLNIQAIFSHCRKQLPAYMVPQLIIRRDALPLNANGKVDRKKLAADYVDEHAEFPQHATQEDLRPSTQAVRSSFLHRWMTEARQLLGIEKRPFNSIAEIFAFNFPDRRVEENATFLSLEGDSLSYVAVSTGIEAFLGYLPDDCEVDPENGTG